MKKKFYILLSAGVVSTALGLPYIFALQHQLIEKASLSLPVVALVGIAQTAVLLAVALFFGLRLAQRIHLPTLTLFEPGTHLKKKVADLCKLSVPLGIVVALLIKFGDSFFSSYIPELAITVSQIPFWKALLVAPYGGVVEEILMRLFLVSLFAWLLGIIFRVPVASKNSAIMWTAIVASSILFGLGHLPATSTIVALTPVVIVRALLLNGVGGMVFGWLYWKKGLEYSIVAHFTTDVVLHAVIFSLLS